MVTINCQGDPWRPSLLRDEEITKSDEACGVDGKDLPKGAATSNELNVNDTEVKEHREGETKAREDHDGGSGAKGYDEDEGEASDLYENESEASSFCVSVIDHDQSEYARSRPTCPDQLNDAVAPYDSKGVSIRVFKVHKTVACAYSKYFDCAFVSITSINLHQRTLH